MRFYFKMSEADERMKAIMNDKKPVEITLYEETDEIKNDCRNNPNSDWWPVWKFGTFSCDIGEFNDIQEATEEFYTNEAESYYCWLHDC